MNQRLTTFAAVLLSGLPAAKAVTYNWSGGSGGWNTPGQWLELTVPASDPSTDLIFGGVGGYTATNDIGAFTLNSLTLNAGSASTVAGNLLNFVTDGAVAPSLLQNGAGAFTIANDISVTNLLTLGGTGTGTTALSGVISGGGGLNFTGARWQLQNLLNSFSGGITIGTGAYVELVSSAGPNQAVVLTPAASSFLGSNTANVLTLNGGTLKVTTKGDGGNASGITAGGRAITFGVNGGTFDLRNTSGTPGNQGGGILTANGGDFNLTLNNSAANPAVIQFNGGENGLTTGNATDGNWSAGNNVLRFASLAGTGPLRVEVTNGATVRNQLANVAIPYTVRGVVGGDPTSGPGGTIISGISRGTGRMMLDSVAEATFTSLRLEGAVQVGIVGTTRAMNGTIVVAGSAGGNAGYVDFTGRGTGTQLSSAVNAPNTGTAGQNPMWLLRNSNGTLTIEDGGIAVLDVRQRTDAGGTNGNGVALDGPATIAAGGTLRFHQSASNFTPGVAATNANAGDNIVYGDITGQGTTARESVVTISLPAPDPLGTTANQIPFTLTAAATTAGQRPYGGLVFDDTRGVADFIVNGSGFGGLRIETVARPAALLSGGGADLVTNVAKMNSVLTDARLSRLSGSGGYLTLAPANELYTLNPGAVWSDPDIGLRVSDHNPTGADISFGGLGSWTNNLVIDSGATLDLGTQSPFILAGPGGLHGKGTISGTGSLFVDTGGSLSPGLNDIGTLTIGVPLSLSGGLNIGINSSATDRLAVAGALTLGGPLAITGAFGGIDLVIASYSGLLTGTFSSITGLDPGFVLDYGSGNNGVITLKSQVPTRTWNGNLSGAWNTTAANWQGGVLFANGNKVVFNDTAAGPNFVVTVGGGDVSPSLITVDNNTKAYSLISGAGSAITGAGKLVKMGTGLLTLSGPATFGGGIEINGGELRIGAANSLPDGGGVSIASGAALNTQGNSDTIGDLAVNGSVVGGGTLSVGALSIGPNATLVASIALAGNLIKTGGSTTLTGSVDLGGAPRGFDVAAGGGNELTITGPILNGALTKSGNGTLTLSGTGSTQTATTVTGGTLTSLNGIPNGIPVSITNGGILNLTHGSALNFTSLADNGTLNITDLQALTLAALSGSGSINGATSITVNTGAGSSVFSGTITGAGTAFVKNGPGVLHLGGANSSGGPITINAGVLSFDTAAAAGSSLITVNGGALDHAATLTNSIVMNGGMLGSSAGAVFQGTLTVTADAVFRNADPEALGTESELDIRGNGLHGAGNILAQTNNGDGSADQGVGIRLRSTQPSTYTGTITVANTTKFELQTTAPGPFSPMGAGKIKMTGGTFTGGLQGTYSELNLRNNGASDTTFGNDLEIIGTGIANLDPLGSVAANTRIVMGNLRLGGDHTLAANRNGATLIVEFPTVTLTGGNATFSPTTAGAGFSGTSDLALGVISEIAPSGIVMTGQTNLFLEGANTYTGTTRIESGNVYLGAAGALPITTDLTVNGGTLDLTHPTRGSFDQFANSLSGIGGFITNSGANSRSLFVNQAANTTFGGSLSGNLSFDKQNTGTLTLSGFNNHAGPTFATAGTLLVTGDNGSSPVIVGTEGTFGGTGTAGAVNVGGAGKLAPGVLGPGFLATGAVTFDAGAIFAVELNGAAPGTGYDQLNVIGAVSIGAGTMLSLSLGYNPADNVDVFTIILNDGIDPVTGTFAGLANNASFTAGGQSFVISYFDESSTPGVEFSGGNDITLMAIPEPGTAALLLGGLGGLLAARRRRVS